MKTRQILSTDFMLISCWKILQGQTPVPLEYWPKLGKIVLDKDNKPLAAAWLIETSGPFCMVDWVIADPLSDKIERRVGLKMLISELYAIGQQKGYPLGYALISKQSIVGICEELGFTEDGNNLIGMIKRL